MKDRFVVCVVTPPSISRCGSTPTNGKPKKEEIYEVIKIVEVPGYKGYSLAEFHYNDIWSIKYFRPVDHDSGNAIAEYVEQALIKELQFEEALKELTV